MRSTLTRSLAGATASAGNAAGRAHARLQLHAQQPEKAHDESSRTTQFYSEAREREEKKKKSP